MSGPNSPTRAASLNCQGFTLLYAVAVLFHIVWTPVVVLHPAFTGPQGWLVAGLVGGAVLVIHRPASVGRVVVLAVIQLIDVAYYLPFCPNHWLLTGILSLAILGAAAVTRGGRPPEASGGELGELYQTLTPPVRLSAVIFYFCAGFHKLNADFLNPDVSCAVRFFERAVSPFPALSALSGVEAGFIWATLAVELFLAVGLAVPRWRQAACLLGAGFHMLLALDAAGVFYNFSSVMFVFLWVCLPASRAAWIARQPGGRFGRFHFLAGYAAVVAGAWWFPTEAPRVTAFGFSGLWLACALTLLSRAGLLGRYNVVQLARAAYRPRVRPTPLAPIAAHPRPRYAGVLLLVPALVLLNGLSPYLGLKTRTAWQMYSQLNLEPATSNHYLIPYSLDVGGFLADSAAIVATSDPVLRAQYVATGKRITWFELRRHVAQQPSIHLAYLRRGHPPQAFGPAEEDAALHAPAGVWGKLLIFRPLGPNAGKVCDW